MPRREAAQARISPSPEALARGRRLVLAHGWNATAYQILNPGIRLWFSAEEDAVIGFVDSHGIRVVAGAPVCTGSRLAAVARDFEREAGEAGLRVCYFCAGTRLRSMLDDDGRHCAVVIGAQPAWDPADWDGMVASHASLRAQLNRARNKQVRVREWPPERAEQHPELNRCLDEWLSTRGLPPLHFLVESRTLGHLSDRRVFVASRGGVVTGYLLLSPIPSRRGWLVEQVIRGKGAPNGTAELLIDAAARTLHADGCHYVTLGLSPLSTCAGEPGTGGPPWLRFVLAWLRMHVSRFYNFRGLEAFKAKFRPAVWEPIFAIASEPSFSPQMLRGIAGAFSDRSLASTLSRAVASAAHQEIRWLGERLRK